MLIEFLVDGDLAFNRISVIVEAELADVDELV